MIYSILAASILFASSINGAPIDDVAGMGGLEEDTSEGEVGTMVNMGTIVPPGTYPFMTYANNCGATLVAPNVLLSAAHCGGDSFGFETWDHNVTGDRKVYVGLHDWYNDTRPENYESIVIEEKVPHPKYDDWTLDYDYMMVKLKTNSNFTYAQLDDGSLTLNRRSVLTLMGWGRTGYYGNGYCDHRTDDYYNDLDYCWPDNLLEADTFFYSRRKCNEFYDQYYEDYYEGRPNGGWITARMHCSLDKGTLDGVTDVWSGKGDSGGPIIDKDTQKLIGVVSWGGDGGDLSPMVYAFVRNQYNWINSWIEDWNMDPNKVCTDMNNVKPCNEKEGCSWTGGKRNGSCEDAKTNAECSAWNGNRRGCLRNGCLYRKNRSKCKSRWP